MTELGALVAKLLLSASTLSGYAPPAAPPRVSVVTERELRAVGCSGQCSANGLYSPGRGILISDRLDPAADVRARAVLLHEIVHYLQDLNGAFGDLPSCERYLAREREAYAVENRYLRRYGQPPDNGYAFLAQALDLGRCARPE